MKRDPDTIASSSPFGRRRLAAEPALTLLRLVVGVILVAHGTQKLADPLGTAQSFEQLGIWLPHFSVWLAIAGEFLGGIGVLVGLFTRVAALGPFFTMLVAIATAHLGNGLFARNGGWEYPLTLLFVSLVFVTYGGGPYSLDALLHRRKTKGEHSRVGDYPSPREVAGH
jgi:putative oxidoreductase